MRGGVNNSTFVRDSQVSNSIRITQPNMDSIVEEDKSSSKKKGPPMLYKTEVTGEKKLRLASDGANSDSDGSDSDSIDESEQLDKVSNTEDMVMKEAAAKQAGKIISDEQDEIVGVAFETYAKYFSYAGGWCVIIVFNLLMLGFISLQMAGNYFT